MSPWMLLIICLSIILSILIELNLTRAFNTHSKESIFICKSDDLNGIWFICTLHVPRRGLLSGTFALRREAIILILIIEYSSDFKDDSRFNHIFCYDFQYFCPPPPAAPSLLKPIFFGFPFTFKVLFMFILESNLKDWNVKLFQDFPRKKTWKNSFFESFFYLKSSNFWKLFSDNNYK